MSVLYRINQKTEKLRRYCAAKFRPAPALPFFWHVGRPNFGDDINPLFFAQLADKATRLSENRAMPHFLGIGSIMSKATAASTILGSGFLTDREVCQQAPAHIVSVRGKLSCAMLDGTGPGWLGDPLVLVDHIMAGPREIKHRYGFVPHYSDFRRYKSTVPQHIKIIDPSAEPWQVVREIASCEMVMSQSLHGLIVADAFAVPNVWIEPGPEMKGGRFKFDDYFTTLDAPKNPFAANTQLLSDPPADAFDIGRYIFDKSEFLGLLKYALAAGPRL